MTWLAVKQFLKKSWKFIKDQWLFFLTAVVGLLGFIFGSGRGKNAEDVLELRRKAEAEERSARLDEQVRREEMLEALRNRLNELGESEKAAAEKIIESHAEEFQRAVNENREKPLSDVVTDLATKYGLTKV